MKKFLKQYWYQLKCWLKNVAMYVILISFLFLSKKEPYPMIFTALGIVFGLPFAFVLSNKRDEYMKEDEEELKEEDEVTI